jgi:predicted RNA-binding protein with PUA-like domain
VAYWLVKSEPSSWSWDKQVKKGTEHWDGVRNHQANNFMKDMKTGDKVFFYHSGDERQIVGICEVAKEHYPDDTDKTGKFGMVDLKTVGPVKTPVTLTEIKKDGRMDNLLLIRNSRLSVMPIDAKSWKIICKMAGVAT